MAGIDVTPQLILAFAALVTSLTALVKLFLTHGTVQQTAAEVHDVKEQTNGALEALQTQIKHLQATQATPAELAARPPHQFPPAGGVPPASGA